MEDHPYIRQNPWGQILVYCCTSPPPHLRKTRKSSLFLEHKELISCQESSSPELADISGERSMVCSCLMSTKLQIFFCSMEKNSQLLLRYNGPDLSREIGEKWCREGCIPETFLGQHNNRNRTRTILQESMKSSASPVLSLLFTGLYTSHTFSLVKPVLWSQYKVPFMRAAIHKCLSLNLHFVHRASIQSCCLCKTAGGISSGGWATLSQQHAVEKSRVQGLRFRTKYIRHISKCQLFELSTQTYNHNIVFCSAEA